MTTADHIVQASLAAFAQYGYQKTSMQDIADAAGVSRPALYQYFKNKKSVFSAVVNLVIDQGIHAAKATYGEQPETSEQLVAAVLALEAKIFLPLQGSPHAKTLLDAGRQIAPEEISKSRQYIYELISQFIVRQGHTKTVADSQTSTLLNCLEGLKDNAKDWMVLKEQTESLFAWLWAFCKR